MVWRVDSFSDISDQLVFSQAIVVFLPYQIRIWILQSAVSAVEPDRHGLAPPAITTEIEVIDA